MVGEVHLGRGAVPPETLAVGPLAGRPGAGVQNIRLADRPVGNRIRRRDSRDRGRQRCREAAVPRGTVPGRSRAVREAVVLRRQQIARRHLGRAAAWVGQAQAGKELRHPAEESSWLTWRM